MVKLCASLDGSFKALRHKIGFLLRDYGSKTSTIPTTIAHINNSSMVKPAIFNIISILAKKSFLRKKWPKFGHFEFSQGNH